MTLALLDLRRRTRAALGFALSSGEKERAGDYPAPHTLFAALASQQKLTMSAYASSSFPIVPITGDMVARAARTLGLTDPRPDAAFTSGAARSLSPVGSLRASRGTVRPRTTADSPAFRPLHFTHASAAQATQIAAAPFRDQKQPRLPKQTFVRSQNAWRGKEKSRTCVRPFSWGWWCACAQKRELEKPYAKSALTIVTITGDSHPGSARLMAFASLRYANPPATMLACSPMRLASARLGLRCHQTRVAPKCDCPRRGSLRNGTARAPSTPARRQLVPPPSAPKAVRSGAHSRVAPKTFS